VHDVDLKGNVIADEESPAMMPEAVEVGQNPEVPPAEDDLDRAALGAHLTSLGATRADRTMESYALEFLHTAEANLVDAHKRVSASLTVDSIRLRTTMIRCEMDGVLKQLDKLILLLDDLELTRSAR
jgi:hypothetical protein